MSENCGGSKQIRGTGAGRVWRGAWRGQRKPPWVHSGNLSFFYGMLPKLCVHVPACTRVHMLHVIRVQNRQEGTRCFWESMRGVAWAGWWPEEMQGRRQRSSGLWLGQGWGASGSHPSSWHTTGCLAFWLKKLPRGSG